MKSIATSAGKTQWFQGRPPKHDWLALKPQIETLIERGATVDSIASNYQMTRNGMNLVLRRLGLRTLGQAYLAQAREAA